MCNGNCMKIAIYLYLITRKYFMCILCHMCMYINLIAGQLNCLNIINKLLNRYHNSLLILPFVSQIPDGAKNCSRNTQMMWDTTKKGIFFDAVNEVFFHVKITDLSKINTILYLSI